MLNRTPEEQAAINARRQGFNEKQFKMASYFDQVDSKYFQELILYLNSDTEDVLPTRNTLRNWIIKDVVTELFKRAFSRIHTRSLLSLCGIVHFVDNEGQYRSFLLSISELVGRHTGVNIADSVAAIIAEFNIGDQIGYFVLDNASNNDTYMHCCELSQLRHKHGKKDACSLYN